MQRLLDTFWAKHDPTSKPYKRQYISAILYCSEGQKEIAEKHKAEQAKNHAKPITTIIEEMGDYFEAEDYHQKYHLRHSPLFERFAKSSLRDFVDSPIAAKLNGYICGLTDLLEFQEMSNILGLTSEEHKYIEKQIKSGVQVHC